MAGGSLSFEVAERDGSARRGILSHRRGLLQTPALLLYTRRGSPLYLTPDVVDKLGQGGDNYLIDVTKL